MNATQPGLLFDSPGLSETQRSDTYTEGGPESAAPGREQEQIRSLLQQETSRMKTFNNSLETILDRQAQERTPTQSRAAPEKGQEQTPAEEIEFNLVQTDIIDVIRMFMELLEEDYLLHPGINGRVTLHVQDRFNREQLFELFLGLLRLNGLTSIRNENNILEIMPLSQAPTELRKEGLLLGQDLTGPGNTRGQTIQAFPLQYIRVEEVVKVITPFLSKNAFVYGSEQQGLLLISDYPHNLAKTQKLIELFDVSVFADIMFEIHSVQNVNVSDLVQELEGMAQGFGLPEAGRESVSFLGFERLNLLLVLSRDQKVLEFAGAWVEELDRTPPKLQQTEIGTNVYVYYVQNSNAEDLVASLTSIFEVKEQKEKEEGDKEEGPLGTRLDEASNGTASVGTVQVKGPASASVSQGQLTREVTFVVDETTNAVLIRCASEDYGKILTVIEKLDLYPKQALIEVMIAEVNLDKSNKLGIEWSYLMEPHKDIDINLSQDSGLGLIGGDTSIGSGFTYLIEKVDRFQLMLKALAEQNQARILSSPHILASDNKEASINIGQEVPIVTSELRTTEGTSTATQVDKTIQYRDTGIILNVTPHINENGLVRMELSQEISDISQTKVEGVDSPVFTQRQASTTVAVKDGQTIVIGGLIRQKNTITDTSVPGLGRIPYLKYFFGATGNDWENTELLIFITPHVIQTQEDSQFFTRRFTKRLKEIKEDMR